MFHSLIFASEIHGFMATPHTFKKTYHNFYEKQRLKSVWLYSILGRYCAGFNHVRASDYGN
jgi:hypothetical protein